MRWLVLVATLLLWPTEVGSKFENACVETRQEAVDALVSNYGEYLLGEGLTMVDSVVSLWVDPEDRSWTILVTLPAGLTCWVSQGTDWELPPTLEKQSGRRL